MFTYGDVVTAARDRHGRFDVYAIPQAVARREAARLASQLHERVAAVDDGVLRRERVVEFPLADFAAGIRLPAHRRVTDVMARTLLGTEAEVDVVHPSLRADRGLRAATGWILVEHGAPVLHLRPPEQNWLHVAALTIGYVPVLPSPDQVVDAQPVDLPDGALTPLGAALAYFMAGRVRASEAAGSPAAGVDLGQFAADAARAEAAFLDGVASRYAGTSFVTRDVFP